MNAHSILQYFHISEHPGGMVHTKSLSSIAHQDFVVEKQYSPIYSIIISPAEMDLLVAA
jgi:hypothetical protein